MRLPLQGPGDRLGQLALLEWGAVRREGQAGKEGLGSIHGTGEVTSLLSWFENVLSLRTNSVLRDVDMCVDQQILS